MNLSGEGADKLTTLDAACRAIYQSYVVGLGGMMLYRRPVAMCRALAEAQTNQKLTVVTFSAGFETDLLVNAGVVETLRTCYAGLEVFGPAPAVKAAVERGELRLVDETELTLAMGLQAAALHVPWLPSAEGVLGTDFMRVRDDLIEFSDQISGRRLLALPAIAPDICVIHVPIADTAGNAAFGSSAGLDREMASAAHTVILTAEEVVDTETLLERYGEADILSFQTSMVVECPGGARPTSCYPQYPYDGYALLDYLEVADA